MEDLRGTIIGVNVLLIVLLVAATSLRALSRHLAGAGLSWDDWLSFAAAPPAIAVDALNINLAINHGLGLHVLQAPRDAFTWIEKFLYADEIFYNVILLLAKLSVLCFYRRVFANTTYRIFHILIWGLGAFLVVNFVALTFAGIFQCTPVARAWDKDIPGTCIDAKGFFLGQAVPNIVTDFVVLVLPVPLLLKLRVSLWQRIALVGVFALGYVVPAISLLRLVSVVDVLDFVAAVAADAAAHTAAGPPDVTWRFVSPFIWTTVECNLAVISICIPALQYLVKRLRKRSGSSTARRFYADHSQSREHDANLNHRYSVPLSALRSGEPHSPRALKHGSTSEASDVQTTPARGTSPHPADSAPPKIGVAIGDETDVEAGRGGGGHYVSEKRTSPPRHAQQISVERSVEIGFEPVR